MNYINFLIQTIDRLLLDVITKLLLDILNLLFSLFLMSVEKLLLSNIIG